MKSIWEWNFSILETLINLNSRYFTNLNDFSENYIKLKKWRIFWVRLAPYDENKMRKKQFLK